jgi:outer membrane usher protein FimD/PapC
MTQAEGLPQEFHEHFFDVPLAVHIVLDRRPLGEAMVTLSKDERITLVEFTDTQDSTLSNTELDAWRTALQQGIALGPCQGQCTNGLVAAHYSLEQSELSLVTNNAERDVTVSNYHQPPQDGSTGLMLRHQVNLAGGQEQDAYGRLALQGITSLGNWTQTFTGQVSRNDTPEQVNQYQVYELHTQKEWQQHFLRLGYFTPDSSGLSRQIRTFGNHPDTTIGVMLGSSDSLTKDGARPAIYPIYVTANRNATVEIYRNGALINSQQVQPGLQTLDTRPLPGGIYDVEVRLVEDGIVTSTTDELVYKPSNWNNVDQRWRYNAFVGRDNSVLSNDRSRSHGALAAGIAANYLVHPRAVVGVSARKVNEQDQLGTSLDLGLGARSSLYANVYQTKDHGTGTDIQAIHNYDSGNLVLSHNRSWLDTRNTWETLSDGTRIRQRQTYNNNVSNTGVGINHRLSHHNSLNARVSYSEGQTRGTGLDLGWLRSSKLMGNDANWRLSVFDRPASTSSGGERNRGIDLSLNLAIGSPGRRISASLGQRTSREGDNDRNASLGYQQDIVGSPIRTVNATLNSDTYGTGLTGQAQFETDVARGDFLLQRSSYNQKLSGNLNVDSTLVVGANKVAMSGQYLGSDASMIVDLESDLDDVELRADDLSGHGAILRPGRNVVPVGAYKSGVVQFDFQGVHAPAASIHPARATYHLNKGGVAHQQVRLMKTVTVFGRLIDGHGQPLKGVHVLNHASRGVTEIDGFFSMELSSGTPTLEVVRGENVICRLVLDPKKMTSEGDVLMTGDLPCVQGSGLEKIAKG